MPAAQAGPSAPLFNMQTVRAEDGPPLSVASDLCRAVQLQGIFAVSDLHVAVLLGGFRGCGGLGVDGAV